MTRKVAIVAALAAVALTHATAAAAQEDVPVAITTPYPGVVVEPGDTATFGLDITAGSTRRLDLSVAGVPPGWSTLFRGGGSEVTRVTASPGDPAEVTLQVEAPADASEGTHRLEVRVSGEGASATLDLTVEVRPGAAGEVTLEPEFPALRGPTDATFTFDVTVRNATPREVQLELSAGGPAGWRVEARPTGERQASTLTVDAGGTARVGVEADPPIGVASGDYEIFFRVEGSDVTAEIPLGVRIVGDFSIGLTTPDQRLNVTVTGGEQTEYPLVVMNDGTAPLTGIELAATLPRNWEVAFEPAAVPTLDPGDRTTVTATITPSPDAIAGDYLLTFRATTDQSQDSVEVRATVSPSAVWGLIGVGLIALTLVALAAVFRRFGRR